MNKRPTWEEYFKQMAKYAATRSTCLRRQVGAIAVMGNRIIATGYNGAPPNVTHCSERGCLRQKLNIPSGERHEVCYAMHAEQNLIVQCAQNGLSMKDSTVFCTTKPCFICTKMLYSVGIKSIYWDGDYPDEMTDNFLKEVGTVDNCYARFKS